MDMITPHGRPLRNLLWNSNLRDLSVEDNIL